jgi:hypothetical protein
MACFSALSAEVAQLGRPKRTTAESAGIVPALDAGRGQTRGAAGMCLPAVASQIDWKRGRYCMSIENGPAGLPDAFKVPH